MMEATLPLSLSSTRKAAVIDICDNSIVVASKKLLCCELPEGAIILELVSGVYYGLDPVGTHIWGLIQEPKVVNDVRSALLDEYDVEPERCERDLLNLLVEMTTLRLIEVRNETAS
jgi:hypothetical protein